MGRMTRAKAAEVAERMHIDEDAVLELPSENDDVLDAKPATPEPADRAVLCEIAPNSAESTASAEIANKKTRSKKKGAKKTEAVEEQPEVVEEEGEAENGEAQEADQDVGVDTEKDDELEATTNETLERLAKMRITSIGNEAAAKAATGPSENGLENAETPAPALDSSDAVANEESFTPVDVSKIERPEDELPQISVAAQPEAQEPDTAEPEQTALEAPGSPVESAVPKAIKNLQTETPGKRSTSNKENVEPVEPVQPVEPIEPTETTSPSRLPESQPSPSHVENPEVAAATQQEFSPTPRRRSSDKSEDPIEALDELEEAVEKVNLEIPEIPASPEKQRNQKPTTETEKPKKTKPPPVVRLTKAAQARLSMAQGGDKDVSKTQTSARSRPSTTAGRPSTVRQSVVPSSTTSRRVTSTSSNANATKPEPKPKKESVIPHSKPRPVSLSFPTPPPAAKSSKAPTKSTFQLPGEAVAAKLKAAREERLKREATTATTKTIADKKDTAAADKKPAFKARPAPNMLKKTPSVRQTAASRARESAMNGGASATAAPKPSSTATANSSSLKRSNTVATSRPRPSTITTKTTAPSQLNVTKRPRPSSVQIPASSAPRPSTSGSSGAAPRSTSGTAKGKEVFSRAATAKLAAETEKREKEEAARKARAAAAERGRALSREWAEKQKAKKAAAAGSAASQAPAAVAPAAAVTKA